ncbi:MAG: DUF819 family protein [Candidatus Omnitrophica bacterium]|nr:DUF819 family protein [Candidatus Omnitrophota bacterium]
MIHHPVLIIIVLLAIEVLVLALSKHPRTRHWFDFIPSVFWIYFLPMMASTAGLIDPKAPVLSLITSWLLPASLLLLLIVVDIKAILRLGGMALGMFFIGSAGIIAGTVISFIIFKHLIGAQFWAGFGALSASWTGGSANMIAVKEALSVPDAVFAPMVIVDTVVPYVWMGIMIAGVGLQGAFDRWNRSDRSIIDELGGKAQAMAVPVVWSRAGFLRLVLLLGAGTGVAYALASTLPVVKDIISTYAWTIIVVSVIGLVLSLTPVRRLEKDGASPCGYYLLYFVLTAIGAKASVAHISSAFILIAAGFVIVGIHAIFLLVGARMLKAPMFLVATASQANVGGVASAPVVAAVYQPGLASVGLLLAILGNIVGTYMGILCAQLCRFFA